VLEKASEDHPDIVFCRVNTEEQKALSQAFEVKSIPTLIVVRDRIMIASQPGMLPKSVLEDLIDKVKKLDMDEVRREMAQEEEQKGNGS
jgi:thioredoxin-like negative regulator of GroEL